MKFTVLGSGSSGNATIISDEETHVLVDAGLSAKEILRRLALKGINYERLDAVVITHEHADHIGGLRVLLQYVTCPVFISEQTLEAYLRQANEKERYKRLEALRNRIVSISSSKHFRIGTIDFNPFSVPHDAADNFGLTAEAHGVKIACLMDFGYITTLIKDRLKGCDGIIIESNHNRDMLMACPFYSWDLKQRIASRTGHLSNEDLSQWLLNDFDGCAREIVLAHLSQKTNEPNLALLTARNALASRSPLFRCDTRVTVSHPKEPTEWIIF